MQTSDASRLGMTECPLDGGRNTSQGRPVHPLATIFAEPVTLNEIPIKAEIAHALMAAADLIRRHVILVHQDWTHDRTDQHAPLPKREQHHVHLRFPVRVIVDALQFVKSIEYRIAADGIWKSSGMMV